MFCKNCGEIVSNDQKFCANCGTTKGQGNSFCEICGNPVSENMDICPACGGAISKANEAVYTSADAPAEAKGAKKYLGVIFGIMSFFASLILGILAGIPMGVVGLVFSMKDLKKQGDKLAGVIGLCFSAGTLAYCAVQLLTFMLLILFYVFYIVIMFMVALATTL